VLRNLALVGYGHFTTLRCTGGRIKGLTRHLDRLTGDARTVFGAELDREEIRALIRQAVGDAADIVVRVTVADPELELAHPGAPAHPRLLVTTRPAPTTPPPPLRALPVDRARGVHGVKHTGLFEVVHARREAQLLGFDDAVFAPSGWVCEGTTWSLGFWKADRIVWPSGPSLPGITAALLNEVRASETHWIKLSGLVDYEAAFAVNCVSGIRPISVIGDAEFDPGHPVFQRLREIYEDIPGDRA
jgi:branched-subunit amino acid aminotransferase/4-amino-4-deoxychorismate lyase